GKLAVGVENVEFGFVGGEGSIGVLGRGRLDAGGRRISEIGQLRFLAGNKRVHGAVEQIAIVGEIGDDVQLVAVGDDADEVGRGHLLAGKTFRGSGGASEV